MNLYLKHVKIIPVMCKTYLLAYIYIYVLGYKHVKHYNELSTSKFEIIFN